MTPKPKTQKEKVLAAALELPLDELDELVMILWLVLRAKKGN